MGKGMIRKPSVIMIEGADASGKSTLCGHLMNMVAEGKCHLLHSNYDKSVDNQAHYYQHLLYTDFIIDAFSKHRYTGNWMIIQDRCYISDICYGKIGYGSSSSLPMDKCKEKLYYLLSRMSRRLSDDNSAVHPEISIIYCRPDSDEVSTFNDGRKEELLDIDEYTKVGQVYDSFFGDKVFLDKLRKTLGIKTYIYDYTKDKALYDLLVKLGFISKKKGADKS